MDINVVLGRFNPFTKGHYKIITEINNNYLTYIFVIDGEQTGKNITKNPLTLFERISYITDLNIPNTKILYASTAYEILDICEVLNLNIKNVICGTDREQQYKKLFNTNIICFDRNDNISSTKIRNFIKNNDYNEYEKLMVPSYKNKKIFNIINKRLSDGIITNSNNKLQ